MLCGRIHVPGEKSGDERAASAAERRWTVLDPAELYRLEPDVAELSEPVLVIVLDGFVDAGAAARLAVESLVASGPGRPVAHFDVDQLVDYRSRRPPLRFETDRWTGYSAPELDVVALTDTGGTEFLLLSGPEPDTQWERFAAAVEQLVQRLGIRLVVNMTGIPMAVPHTRPIGVTVHGTRPELTEGHESLFASAEVPGSAVALVEYRLGQAGHAAMGFAVHVPHYLARAEYPQAARVLVDHLAVTTGLYLSTEALTAAAERAEREITEQVEGSDEVAQVVAALERQYDTVVSGGVERSGAGLGGELPSADELAAEVERFLAGHDDTPGEDGDPDER
jgi:proteasome assembly chaperone (PAC2) family protein